MLLLLLLALFWRCVKDDVGFDQVSDTPSLGALASGVDGVNDGGDEGGVTDDGLIVHDPSIDKSSAMVHRVEWVLCVVSEHAPSPFLGGSVVAMRFC